MGTKLTSQLQGHSEECRTVWHSAIKGYEVAVKTRRQLKVGVDVSQGHHGERCLGLENATAGKPAAAPFRCWVRDRSALEP